MSDLWRILRVLSVLLLVGTPLFVAGLLSGNLIITIVGAVLLAPFVLLACGGALVLIVYVFVAALGGS